MQLLKRIKRMERRARAKQKESKQLGLLDFGTKYFAHHFKNKMPDFHRELVEDLEALGPDDSISRIAPRGAAKSTWVTLIYPIWKTVYRLKRYIILLGDTQPNASKFLDNIRREFEDNEELRSDFPDCRPGTVWRAEAIELTSGTLIEALCYGKGKIRGRRFGHYRPDLVIIDDPQNADDALSHELMEKDEQWLQSDVMNAGEPGTNYILVGTALVNKCLVLQHANRPTWKHKTYKSLIQEPKNMGLWKDWFNILCQHHDENRIEKAKQWYMQHKSGEDGMDFGAKVLWPDRIPLEDLMLKKFTNPRAFASEQQGEPMPPGCAEWPAEWFDDVWVDEFPHARELVVKTLALDPSKGRTDKLGDYSAYVGLAIDRLGIIYIGADMSATRDALRIVQDGLNIIQKWKPDGFAVETNAFAELFGLLFKTESEQQQIHLRFDPADNRDGPMFLPVEHYQSKVGRIREWSKPLGYRKVKFVRSWPQTQLLLDQFMMFPTGGNDPGVDDGPDSAALGLSVANDIMKHGSKLIRAR